MSEFPDRPATAVAPSDPALDPLGTFRMEGPNTLDRRLDPKARRVVKVDYLAPQWVEVGSGEDIAPWHADDAVVDWSVQPDVCRRVAMDRGNPNRAAVPAPAAAALSGDDIAGVGDRLFR